jgi:toxin ParE1/3/4
MVWSALARTRLREIRAYVAQAKLEAAERLATRIVAVLEALRNQPYVGRAGAEPGIRELVIGGISYIVLYRIDGWRVVISTIWHGAQRREG